MKVKQEASKQVQDSIREAQEAARKFDEANQAEEALQSNNFEGMKALPHSASGSSQSNSSLN
jgi:hypothetical protein